MCISQLPKSQPAASAARLSAAALAAFLLVCSVSTAASAQSARDVQPEEPKGLPQLPPQVATGGGSLGCTVLLCLANPGGPTQLAACVKPIKELTKRLAKGRSFPMCEMGSAAKGNYAQRRGDLIDVFVDGQLLKTVNWRRGEVAAGSQGGGNGAGEHTAQPQQNR